MKGKAVVLNKNEFLNRFKRLTLHTDFILMALTLLSSPLQSFTECHFRNALNRHFGGIDTYYAPYIRLNGQLEIKPKYEKDLLRANNSVDELIPQVMTNDPDEFLFVADYVKRLGYNELNWNLGCPYPMVTKRCMGSGLIQETKRIEEVLRRVHEESDIIVSMKMRLGFDEPTEIIEAFKVINDYPIKNIAIHARLGKQLYKGGVDWDGFGDCIPATHHKLYYNGDITSVESFKAVQNQFPTIDHWMIGRGLIIDPFLPSMIKANTFDYPVNRAEIFRGFHDELFDAYVSGLSGKSHVLTKMTSYWEYFALSFDDSHRTFKKIKKAKSISDYENVVKELICDANFK